MYPDNINEGSELNHLRIMIDEINIAILELLNKRAKILMDITTYKDKMSMEYFDIEREHEMMVSILKNNIGPLHNTMKFIIY